MYMEAFLFERPELCMHALHTGSNACGVELYHSPFLHYAVSLHTTHAKFHALIVVFFSFLFFWGQGNFWWTTCARVRELEEPDGMLPMTESTWGK